MSRLSMRRHFLSAVIITLLSAVPFVRAQSAGSALSFATQVEVIICLADGHGDAAAETTSAEMKIAYMGASGLTDAATVAVEDSVVENCSDGEWEMRVSVYNAAAEPGAAFSPADIAGAQIDTIHADEEKFLDKVAAQLPPPAGGGAAPAGSDFTIAGLGFVVLWLDDVTVLGDGAGSSGSSDVVNVWGVAVYWPAWMWGIYVAVVLICVLPLAVWLFRSREKVEAVRESRSPEKDRVMGHRSFSRSSLAQSQSFRDGPPAAATQQRTVVNDAAAAGDAAGARAAAAVVAAAAASAATTPEQGNRGAAGPSQDNPMHASAAGR